MAERKTFLLRIDGQVLESLRHWADDDLRSLNGQIEFVLRKALRDRGRLKGDGAPATETPVSRDEDQGDETPAPA